MMDAAKEVSRIVREGRLDNSQVVCLADALVGYAGEACARKFVNKQLEESDIKPEAAFPRLFSREKFRVVNLLWKQQTWMAHHRFVETQETAAVLQPAEEPTSSSARATTAALRKKLAAAEKRATDVEEKWKAAEAAFAREREALRTQVAETSAHQETNAEAVRAEATRRDEELRAAQEKLDALEHELKKALARGVQLEQMVEELKAAPAETSEAAPSSFPEEVQTVGTKLTALLTAPIDGVDAGTGLRIANLYLTMISSASFETARFETWFAFFDEELYRLLSAQPERLKTVRDLLEDDLNGRLHDVRVSWNLIGDSFDEARYRSNDAFGDRVTEVISALMVKPDGTIVRRAKVRTAKATES